MEFMKSNKAKRAGFFVLMGIITIYFVVVIVKYYVTSSDKNGIVKLTFKADDTNITTIAEAEYALRPGEGRLIMSSEKNDKTDIEKGIIGTPVTIEANGGKVSKETLKFTYSEAKLYESESDIVIVRLENGGEKITQEKSSVDLKNNTVTAGISGDGVWAIADRKKLEN